MIRLLIVLIAGAILLANCGRAHARPRHHHHAPQAAISGAGWPDLVVRSIRTIGTVGHPEGCPRRAFCGCGAAVRVFGAPRRDLWLAASWLRFPRAVPAPGMVAARRGHVFVLEQHVEGHRWIVYDANSGGHATRIHERSIAGFTVVDPRA